MFNQRAFMLIMKTLRFTILFIWGFLYAFSSFAFAFEVNGIYYAIIPDDEKCVYVSGYKKEELVNGNIYLPAKVLYDNVEYKVKKIADRAFEYCNDITSVTIEDGLEAIGKKVFFLCENLKTINIPKTINTIGYGAFKGCKSLSTIYIPQTVTFIDECVFDNCPNLISISVDNKNTKYSSIDGVLFNKEQDTLVACPGGKKGTYAVPDKVIHIGDWAFSGCASLISLTLPESIRTIGDISFEGCTNLVSINIPNSLVEIGMSAFRNCSSLTSISLPVGITCIKERAFDGCSSLVSFIIPETVIEIESFAFNGCSSIVSFDIPEKVLFIRHGAFGNCSLLTSISIPKSVDIIESCAFQNCHNLTSIYLNWEKITEIPVGENIFGYLGNGVINFDIATIYIPEGTLEAYQSVEPWKYFKSIKTWSSINEESSKNDIFYNDVDETIYLHNEMTSLIIYDIDGNVVKESCNVPFVRTSELPSGIYIAVIKGGKSIKFRK